MVSTTYFHNQRRGRDPEPGRVLISVCVADSLSLVVFFPQQIQEEQLESVMDWLSSQPRAAQLIDKDSTFLSTLEYYMGRYLKDVKQHHVKADKR